MTIRRAILSTSESRREAVVLSAVSVFAVSGYLGTPISEVAIHANISTAYVFKLFPSKEELFVAALERCFDLVLAALAKGADESENQNPDSVLTAMGGAYAALIADRNLLLLQIHAQSAANVPEISRAFRKGLEGITKFVKRRSKASDEMVQRFIAYGQLCHLITIAGLDRDSAAWATILTQNVRHV